MGGIGSYIPKFYEPINGNIIQSVCYLSNSFYTVNGSWIAALASDMDYELGSHLLNLTYGVWINAGLNYIYERDEFGEIVYETKYEIYTIPDWTPVILTEAEFLVLTSNSDWELLYQGDGGVIVNTPLLFPIILGENEFELINGNCWQSIFTWSGLEEVAIEYGNISDDFINYPYNGSWLNSMFQIMINNTKGIYPQPAGPISSIEWNVDVSNIIDNPVIIDTTDMGWSDGTGNGAVFEVARIDDFVVDITILDGGNNYNISETIFIPGGTFAEIIDDLTIYVTGTIWV